MIIGSSRASRGLKRASLYSTAVALVLGGSVSGALAQQAASSGPEIETITVTATRVTEDVQKVPIPVSVVTSADLEESQIQRPIDLKNVVSSLSAGGAGGERFDFTNFSIRGQGVQGYFMEVPNWGLQGGTRLYDLANTQILNGPQGTLFGRVTSGGAILYTPKLPGDKWEGYTDVQIGSFGQQDIEAAVGGPIVEDKFSIRIAGITNNLAGYGYNTFNQSHQDGTSGNSVRVTAKLNLGTVENVTVFETSTSQTSERINQTTYLPTPTPGAIVALDIPIAVAQQFGIACPGNVCPSWYTVMNAQAQAQLTHPWLVNQMEGPEIKSRWVGVLNRTEWKATDWLTVRNIASMYRQDMLHGGISSQVAGGSLPFNVIYVGANTDYPGGSPYAGAPLYTEEFQLQANPFDGLHVQAGAYYEVNRGAYEQGLSYEITGGYTPFAYTPALGPLYAGCVASYRASVQNTAAGGTECFSWTGMSDTQSRQAEDQEAVYAQADYKPSFVDGLTLTAGVRETHAHTTNWSLGPVTAASLIANPLHYDTSVASIPNQPGEPILALDANNTARETITHAPESKKMTWTFNAGYELSQNVMFYASAREGFTPGGANKYVNPSSGSLFYGPQIIYDYTGGVKSIFNVGGMALKLNADVWYQNFTNKITSIFIQVNGQNQQINSNAAAEHARGFDLDAEIKPNDWFSLNGGLTYQKANYTRYPNTGQLVSNGVPATADLVHTLLPLGQHWKGDVIPAFHLKGVNSDYPDLVLSSTISYFGAAINELHNYFTAPDIASYWQVNARLAWYSVMDTNFDASVNVQNLNNYQGIINSTVVQAFGAGGGFRQVPRAFYAELKYHF